MRWLILATLFLVCVCGGAPISAKVLDWPDWTDGKRTLKVYIVSTDAGFQGDVRDAMAAWNTANSGNAWEFQETTDPVAADITIAEVSSGLRPGQGGVARAITKSTGFLGLGSGELVRVDVSIKAGLPAAVREVAIMHELGHCLRLAHDKGPSNVMDPMATVSTPSASDVSEALASDKDPPCPLDASTNLVREQYALVELTPKPQSGVDLANATGVTITAVTGDFSASVLGWDASKITAQIFADSTASHNEVFTATLSYNGASDISYTGVLTVADENAGGESPAPRRAREQHHGLCRDSRHSRRSSVVSRRLEYLVQRDLVREWSRDWVIP